MSKALNPHRVAKHAHRVLLHVALIAASFIALFLLLWLISIAIKPVTETYKMTPSLIPEKLTLDNFARVMFHLPRLTQYYRNSIIITAASVASIMVISALAGYGFARIKFPGRNALFLLVIATIYFPYTISLPALYNFLYKAGLINTLIGVILPYTALWLRLGTLIMRQVFSVIPQDLEDAATIDGCSRFQAFRHVMLPLTSSGWVVVAIFTFVPIWGEFILAFTMTSTPKAMPISIGMQMLKPSPGFGEFTFPVAAAAALIIFIPSLLIFIIFQKWFTKGMIAGALKF